MGRKLKGIVIREVSFVSRPANRKSFLFYKGVNEMEELELEDVLKALGLELSAEEIEKAKKMSDSALKALKGALNILNKYKDEYTAEIKDAIKTLSSYATGKAPYPYPYPEKVKKDEEEEKADKSKSDKDSIELEKAGRKFSKDTVEKIKSVIKMLQDLIPEELTKSEDAPLEILIRELLKRGETLEAKKEEKPAANTTKVDEIIKGMTEIGKRLETVEKATGTKKSIDEPAEVKKEENKGDKWPSLSGLFVEEDSPQ